MSAHGHSVVIAPKHDELRAGGHANRTDDIEHTVHEQRDPRNAGLRTHFSELIGATGDRLSALLFALATAVVLVVGWRAQLERFITPEYGLGYLLGIVGASLMLLLLIYPLRKRSPRLRWLGSVRGWFKAHMIFGVLGPLCILYHCNFSLGAMNSNVALICMLIVAGSGTFGRYFYTRIHYGLYGEQIDRVQLRRDIDITRARLADLFRAEPALEDMLVRFERSAISPARGELHSVVRALSMGVRTHWAYAVASPLIRRAVTNQVEATGWTQRDRHRHFLDARKLVTVYLDLVRKLAQIGLFERLFSLWHVLHVPLFAMMVIAAIVHIVAVHVF